MAPPSVLSTFLTPYAVALITCASATSSGFQRQRIGTGSFNGPGQMSEYAVRQLVPRVGPDPLEEVPGQLGKEHLMRLSHVPSVS